MDIPNVRRESSDLSSVHEAQSPKKRKTPEQEEGEISDESQTHNHTQHTIAIENGQSDIKETQTTRNEQSPHNTNVRTNNKRKTRNTDPITDQYILYTTRARSNQNNNSTQKKGKMQSEPARSSGRTRIAAQPAKRTRSSRESTPQQGREPVDKKHRSKDSEALPNYVFAENRRTSRRNGSSTMFADVTTSSHQDHERQPNRKASHAISSGFINQNKTNGCNQKLVIGDIQSGSSLRTSSRNTDKERPQGNVSNIMTAPNSSTAPGRTSRNSSSRSIQEGASTATRRGVSVQSLIQPASSVNRISEGPRSSVADHELPPNSASQPITLDDGDEETVDALTSELQDAARQLSQRSTRHQGNANLGNKATPKNPEDLKLIGPRVKRQKGSSKRMGRSRLIHHLRLHKGSSTKLSTLQAKNKAGNAKAQQQPAKPIETKRHPRNASQPANAVYSNRDRKGKTQNTIHISHTEELVDKTRDQREPRKIGSQDRGQITKPRHKISGHIQQNEIIKKKAQINPTTSRMGGSRLKAKRSGGNRIKEVGPRIGGQRKTSSAEAIETITIDDEDTTYPNKRKRTRRSHVIECEPGPSQRRRTTYQINKETIVVDLLPFTTSSPWKAAPRSVGKMPLRPPGTYDPSEDSLTTRERGAMKKEMRGQKTIQDLRSWFHEISTRCSYLYSPFTPFEENLCSEVNGFIGQHKGYHSNLPPIGGKTDWHKTVNLINTFGR